MTTRGNKWGLFINDNLLYGASNATVNKSGEPIEVQSKTNGVWKKMVKEGIMMDWSIATDTYTVDFAESLYTANDIWDLSISQSEVQVKVAQLESDYVTEDTTSGNYYFTGSGFVQFEAFATPIDGNVTFDMSVMGTDELKLEQH